MIKFLIPLLLLTMVSCGQMSSQNPGVTNQITNPDWKTFEQSNYSIQYPPTWELNQSGQMGTSFILFSPLKSGQDEFRENVNLLIQDLAGKNIDLNKYTEISEEQIKTMLTNSRLIEEKKLKRGTEEFQKIIYTADQGLFHLKFEQFYFLLSEKIYVLTFTSEESEFAGFNEVAEKILASFKFEK